jgi:hypothetical protein
LGSNGAYLTKAQVAQVFTNHSGVYQQVLATALSVYSTSSDLAGSAAASIARRDGLVTSSIGSGAFTYNVGSNGAVFGVANNSELTIFSLLEDLNSLALNGVLYGANQNLIGLADQVFMSIN